MGGTSIASAYNLGPDALWFPPLIETLIAVSIVYMALENIVGSKVERRWMIAFGFGLVHGFGFSFALPVRCAVRANFMTHTIRCAPKQARRSMIVSADEMRPGSRKC